jgi:hypothetical protein
MKFTKEFFGVCLCMIMCLITIVCLMAGGGFLLSLAFLIPWGIGVIIFTVAYAFVVGVAFWMFASTAIQEKIK